MAIRQLGAEAAAKAGQKKAAAAAAAKAASAPTKEPGTTDQTPIPAATKLSTDAAAESPENAPEATAAKTPTQLAAEGAKRTSVDKIAEAEEETGTGPKEDSASTEEQLLALRRSSGTTKVKSQLSESTPAEESETLLEDKSTTAVHEAEVSATSLPSQVHPRRQHRGSDIGEASPEEIRALEKRMSIEEEDEEDDADGGGKEKEKVVTSTNAVEEEVTKGTETQETEPKDADKAGVSVGD